MLSLLEFNGTAARYAAIEKVGAAQGRFTLQNQERFLTPALIIVY